MSDDSEESPASDEASDEHDDEEAASDIDSDEESTEAEAPENDDAESADPEEDAIGDADIVRLAYTARSLESDQLVDTTDPDVAEDEGIDIEERSIEPRIIPIGAGHLFPSVEADLIGKQVGDGGSVEVSPAEAFGEYDPERVRTVSADTIGEDDRYPGARVEIDGEHGFVETIIGGRARVDFNHPLAGEAIEWEYEILERIEDRLEQARGILRGVVDADLELWIESEEEEREIEDEEDETELVDVETLYIESVPQLALNQQWLFRKRQIAQEILDRVGVDRVIVQETIEGAGGFGDIQGQLEDLDVDTDEITEELDESTDAAEEVESTNE